MKKFYIFLRWNKKIIAAVLVFDTSFKKKQNQVHYYFQLVLVELVIKSTRKWTKSTDQRQIIYNYLFMMSTEYQRHQKVSETNFWIRYLLNRVIFFSIYMFEIIWFVFSIHRQVIGIVKDLKKTDWYNNTNVFKICIQGSNWFLGVNSEKPQT